MKAGRFLLPLLLVSSPVLSFSDLFKVNTAYIPSSGTTKLSLSLTHTSRSNYSVNTYKFRMKYSINDKLEFDLDIPYMDIPQSDESPSLGDIELGIEFRLTDISFLNTSLSGWFSSTINTGETLEYGKRRLETGGYGYFYPFSTGNANQYFGVLSSSMLGDFMFHLSAYYISESSKTEAPFSFKLNNDSSKFSVCIDYFKTISLSDKSFMGIKPFAGIQLYLPFTDESRFDRSIYAFLGVWLKFGLVRFNLGAEKEVSGEDTVKTRGKTSLWIAFIINIESEE